MLVLKSSRTWRRRAGQGAALLVAIGLLSGCGIFSSDDDAAKPAALVDFKPEQRFDEIWSHDVGDGQGDLYYRLRPAVDGDRIFAAANDGEVEAFDRIKGKSLWDVDLDTTISAGVGVGGGVLALASNDGRVWALNADNGEVLWKTSVGSAVLAPPQTDGTIVAVVTIDGHLRGLDAKTGKELWSYAEDAPALTLRASAAPLLYNGNVIAGFSNGRVVSVQATDGKPLWEVRAAVPKGSSEIERMIDVDAAPLISDGVLYVLTYQGNLAAMDPTDGRHLWDLKASSYVNMSRNYNSIFIANPKGTVIAFNKTNPGVRWEQTALARRQLSGVETWKDYVAVGDMEGYVHLLDQSDGHFVARERADSDGVRVQPIAVGDILYVYGNSGDLIAYKLKSAR